MLKFNKKSEKARKARKVIRTLLNLSKEDIRAVFNASDLKVPDYIKGDTSELMREALIQIVMKEL